MNCVRRARHPKQRSPASTRSQLSRAVSAYRRWSKGAGQRLVDRPRTSDQRLAGRSGRKGDTSRASARHPFPRLHEHRRMECPGPRKGCGLSHSRLPTLPRQLRKLPTLPCFPLPLQREGEAYKEDNRGQCEYSHSANAGCARVHASGRGWSIKCKEINIWVGVGGATPTLRRRRHLRGRRRVGVRSAGRRHAHAATVPKLRSS